MFCPGRGAAAVGVTVKGRTSGCLAVRSGCNGSATAEQKRPRDAGSGARGKINGNLNWKSSDWTLLGVGKWMMCVGLRWESAIE